MVRVRFGAGGICGSDMHYFATVGPAISWSRLLWSSVMRSPVSSWRSPADATDRRSAIGRRQSLEMVRHCARCREGRQNLCENIYFMGRHRRHAYARWLRDHFDAVPAQCVKVRQYANSRSHWRNPCRVSPRSQPSRSGGRTTGDRVRRRTHWPSNIAGCSPGRDVGKAVVDVAAAPLAFAQRLGADYMWISRQVSRGLKDLTAERPFDVAFEVSGTAAGLSSAILNVRRGVRSSRSATARAGRSRPTRSWQGSRSQGLLRRFGQEFEQLFASLTREKSMFYPCHIAAPALGGPGGFSPGPGPLAECQGRADGSVASRRWEGLTELTISFRP